MKKIIFVSIVFIFFGFLGAFFIFKFLTVEKPAVITSLPVEQEASVVLPIPSNTQDKKDFVQSAVVNIDTAPESNTQTLLPEKKQETTGENQEVSKEIPTLILNGIFYSKNEKLALINNHIVKEGDLILGVRVERISANSVELDADGQRITLRVK